MKLTLSVDDRVVSRAKQYAKRRGISVSKMVEGYLAAVAEPPTGVAEYRKHLSAHAVTTIHYPIQKEMGAMQARRIISAILRVFGAAAIDGGIAREALPLPFSDFEDTVTAAAA